MASYQRIRTRTVDHVPASGWATSSARQLTLSVTGNFAERIVDAVAVALVMASE